MDPLSPSTHRLLDVALVAGPLAYLVLDSVYTVRGWWDAPTGAAHTLVAALCALTAVALVVLARGRLQTLLLGVAVVGVVGNAGVGLDTVHVGLGGLDLFQEDAGPANLFKMLGFFYPLTYAVAAFALRGRTPRWWPPLLLLGALVFPVAHVTNTGWLALLDGVVLLVALGSLRWVLRADAPSGSGRGVAAEHGDEEVVTGRVARVRTPVE